MKNRKLLLAISLILAGTLSFSACAKKNTTAENVSTTTAEGNTVEESTTADTVKVEPINYALSSETYSIDKEYYFDKFNSLHKEAYNSDVFTDKDDIVFQNISWEELVYLLEQDGNYLILFGGAWCHNTRAAAGYINDYANEYGITTIYNFDFRLDSETRDTHVRETNGSTAKAAEYNYLYGELVTKYLTNLNDWVEYTEDSNSALTYTNPSGEDVTVAKAQVPFLFLYNKDNIVDNSTNQNSDGETKFPIVYGFEEMVDKDQDGVYLQDYETKEKTYITEEYKERLKKIFDFVKNNNVKLNSFSYADYIRTAFNEKAGQELFGANEKININTVGYNELSWLLEQEGNSLVLLGGSWCGNTRAVINTINDYAVKNNVIVYIYDTKVDSGLSKTDRFGYAADLNTRSSASPLVNLYTDLIEKYFTNIVTLYDKNDGSEGHRIDYINENNETISVAKAQVPYLLAYNKDNKNSIGLNNPITGYYEQMLVLDESRDDYVYAADNYAAYKNGVKTVLEAYANLSGGSVEEIESRR